MRKSKIVQIFRADYSMPLKWEEINFDMQFLFLFGPFWFIWFRLFENLLNVEMVANFYDWFWAVLMTED